MIRRRLVRRVTTVDATGGARWRTRPPIPDLRWDMLTADECAAAARVRSELDAVGLAGISDAALDFCLCLNHRLSGERDEPCPLAGV